MDWSEYDNIQTRSEVELAPGLGAYWTAKEYMVPVLNVSRTPFTLFIIKDVFCKEVGLCT